MSSRFVFSYLGTFSWLFYGNEPRLKEKGDAMPKSVKDLLDPNNEPQLRLTGTFWILVINCAFHYLAVAVEAGLGKPAQIDPSLEEASADLGVSPLGTFVRVVLPLMGTAFVVALTYAFVNSMLTLSAIVFLISPGREPAAYVIFAFARMGEMGLASALSLLVIGVVLAALGAVWALARRSGHLALGSAR